MDYKRTAAGLDDGYVKSAIIHKDAYKTMGENTGSVRKLRDGENLANKIGCLSCGRCKSVSYCNREC